MDSIAIELRKEIESVASKMVLNKFKYGNIIVGIIEYDFNDEREIFYLYPDHKIEPYERPYNTALNFLKEFEPASTADALLSDTPKTDLQEAKSENRRTKNTLGHELKPAININKSDVNKSLKEVLINNISKIHNDPSYIPQAMAICKTIDAYINICKLEILETR